MKFLPLLTPAAFAAALVLSSCSGPTPYSPSLTGSSAAEMAPSADRSAQKSRIAEERPGLATGWGKEKSSQLNEVGFVRASSKPAGIDSIYYNDKDGIKAMSRVPSSTNPMQQAAGGLVEWGIKGGIGFLPAYKEWGYGRRMVAGEKNGAYAIVVKNRSKSSLEIVSSVDGLDVMDGKTASFGKRGYIVGPGKTLTIDGFRTSMSSVASFKFSGVSNSYANMRHGDTRNVGVIGIAVFTQKGVDPWTWMPGEIQQRGSARAFAEAP